MNIDKALFPFESHYFDIDGLRMHYLDEGPRDAPVVLMVHGNPSWSFYYRGLAEGLRGQYRVIVPCHIGCGMSDKPGRADYEFTLARRADDLARLIEHLDVSSLSMVVHDWGGMIGTTWAVENRCQVERLVVLNTAAFQLPEGKSIPMSLRLARVPGLGAFLVQGLNLFARGAVRYCVSRAPMTRAVKRAYLAPYDSWHNRYAVHQFVKDIPLSEGDRSWDRVATTARGLARLEGVPMMVCWGMKDFVFDKDFLDEWLRLFPWAEVHRFADAGHYVLEDAGDEILTHVREFLGRPEAAP